MSIKHDHTLNPVIALGLYSDSAGTQLVLAGEGCFLKVFEAESSKLRCLIKVFDDQAIHGILVRDVEGENSGLQIAIWGGYSLILLKKDAFETLLCQDWSSTQDIAITVSDWILDVAISPYGDSCVLVTAHNTVLRARLGKDSNNPHLETLNSPSRSILYSAHLIWESPTCVLVAAGTVFGEIIAWQCSISNETSAAGCRVLATLSGHEGSIFGVNISPLIIGLCEKPTRLLASCSDDRTIRIWDIYGDLIEESPEKPVEAQDSASLRETGFVDNGQRASSPSLTDRCLAMVMGHVSRIWRVKFLINDLGSPMSSSVRVFSFGEDSTVQQWALDFGSEAQLSTPTPGASNGAGQAFKLSHLAKFAFHSGKHIWSAAMRQISDERTLLVTGGADGKISSYEIPLHLVGDNGQRPHTALDKSEISGQCENENNEVLPWVESLDLQHILESITPKSEIGASPTEVAPLQPAPQESTAFQESTAPQESTPPQESIAPKERTAPQELPAIKADEKPRKKAKPPKPVKDAFNRYTFVSENRVLVTTNFGRVLLGQISSPIKWEELLLPESGKEDLKSYSIIKGIPELGVAFLVGANGKVYIYRLGSTINKVAEVTGKVTDIFPLSDPKLGKIDLVVTTLGGKDAILFTTDLLASSQPLTTNTVLYHLPEKFIVTSVGKSSDILVLGARNGSLASYNIARNPEVLGTWIPDEEDNLGDAITSITSLSSPNSNEDHFVTTGRNGIYSVFSVAVTRSEDVVSGSTIRQIHRGTPPLGPNIEAAWFEGQDLLIYGFKSKNFIVWNETKQYEIMNIECGGAHRSYAYSPLHNSAGGYFIYTKASKLYVHAWQDPSHRIIKHGGHGREIKACATSPDQRFIATGAEDTAIRIWRYGEGDSLLDNHFECLAVIQKHTAGIQHLQWCGSKYLFSSAGNEEFFIWAVEFIPGFGMGIVCEASCPDPSEDRDLRIMSFDVAEDAQLSGRDDEPRLLISLAYSDSTIRTYRYSENDGFKLVAKGRYTSSCLLQIRQIRTAGEELYLLTAATDGNLVVWKTSIPTASDEQDQPAQQLNRLSTHTLHQNAIKCLDISISRHTKDIIVASGGDDNAIGVSIYKSENLGSEPRSIILRSSHAAAITGLCFVQSQKLAEDGEEEFRITSSSNDQRVKEWSLSVGREEGLGIKMVGDAFTSVADVGDVVVLRERVGDVKVLIVGNGMEVCRVSCE